MDLEAMMRAAGGFAEDENDSQPQNNQPEQVQTQTIKRYNEPVQEPFVNKIEQSIKEPQKVIIPVENEKSTSVKAFSTEQTKEIIIKSISVYEEFVKLDAKEKSTIIAFLNSESTSTPEIIEAIMNVDSKELNTLSLLVKLLEMTQVKRAFLIMSLDNESLIEVNKLTTKFTDDYSNSIDVNDKMAFGERLEEGIEAIPTQAIPYLRTLNNILEKGKMNG